MPKAKGNLEPRVSNLPRRKQRPRIVRQLSDSDQDSSVKTAVASNKELITTDKPDAIIPPAVIATTPQPLEIPAIQQTLPTRGPIGPHVSNLPRRKVVKSKRRRQIQEILPHSGLFISFFTPSESDSDSEIDSESDNYHSILKIRTADHRGISPSGKFLNMFVPSDLCHDHGMPHLSVEQMLVAWKYLSVTPRPHGTRARQLIITDRERAVDAVALAVGYLARRVMESPSSHLSSCCDQPIPKDIHTILSHIHDFHEDIFDDAWQGVLSHDGIQWLEAVIGMSFFAVHSSYLY